MNFQRRLWRRCCQRGIKLPDSFLRVSSGWLVPNDSGQLLHQRWVRVGGGQNCDERNASRCRFMRGIGWSDLHLHNVVSLHTNSDKAITTLAEIAVSRPHRRKAVCQYPLGQLSTRSAISELLRLVRPFLLQSLEGRRRWSGLWSPGD